MNRRNFLRNTAATSLVMLGTVEAASAQMMGFPMMGIPSMLMGGRMGRTLGTASGWPTGLPLRMLPALANQSNVSGRFEATLTASPFGASVIAGRTTELWGYNQTFPGPLIELWEGEQVAISFANHLALDSTIHWHGLPVPPDQDGSPMDPVAPGASRIYAFDIPAGSAGTYWYHPHAHETVTLQAGHGLVAPLIVRSRDDPLQELPEVTLMVNAVMLDANGQIVTPTSTMGGGMGSMTMAGPGVLLVNGQRLPVHSVVPGATERWRIINATPDRYLRLALDGHLFAVVGTDGGLLEQPLLDQSEWLLAPGQRVEIVVAMSAQPVTGYMLRDLGYSGGMTMSGGGELMNVMTGRSLPQAPIALPPQLRSIANLGAHTGQQQVVLSGMGMSMGTGMGMGMGMGMMGGFLINGRSFDMNRVDLETVVGRVELWDIVNNTMMDHPIHIHGTQFQVVSRTVAGIVRAAPYSAWLDTVNVPVGQTVTIKTQQTMPGKRMVHCHILPHEDAGMMAVLDVKAPSGSS